MVDVTIDIDGHQVTGENTPAGRRRHPRQTAPYGRLKWRKSGPTPASK